MINFVDEATALAILPHIAVIETAGSPKNHVYHDNDINIY